MFIDETIIKVIAGRGGDGCLAYRREKYIQMGGPYGGNGGHGSNIVFRVDTGLHTLIDLRYMKMIKGDKGENGSGNNKHGKSAPDVVIKVPQGTVITDLDTGLIVADMKDVNDEVIVAKGGRGGGGNTAFKTQSNPCPEFAENGEPGEERVLKIELKHKILENNVLWLKANYHDFPPKYDEYGDKIEELWSQKIHKN